MEDQCKFASRCPYVMEKCTQSMPPLYVTHDNQLTRCFLFDDSPETQEPDIGASFEYPMISSAGDSQEIAFTT